MPSLPRVFTEGGINHVYCRASRGEAVFVDETEAAAFVDILRRVKCRAGGECTPFWGVRDPNHNYPQIIDLRVIVGGGGGNRTHVRGTPIAGFSVCSRRFKSHPVVGRRRPTVGPDRKSRSPRSGAVVTQPIKTTSNLRSMGEISRPTWLPKQPVRSRYWQLSFAPTFFTRR